MKPAKPVMVQGVEYPSISAAARHFGISRTGAMAALARGDCISKVTNSMHGKRNAAKPVVVYGVEYPSIKIAAEVLGVCVQTVSRYTKRDALKVDQKRGPEPKL